MKDSNMHLICYSHLRWNFVYQRPQHLLSRISNRYPVLFVEEPVFDVDDAVLEQQIVSPNLWILVPHLPAGMSTETYEELQRSLLTKFLEDHDIRQHIAWYYTPMSLNFSRDLHPSLIVYDCMDELSAFRNAPIELKRREEELFKISDLVFTGGYSLFKSKSKLHPETYLFPSSIDKSHFGKARLAIGEPFEQSIMPHPRIGYFGVIDERMDLELVEELAVLRPEWHFIFIGPVVKISTELLPLHSNLHFFGARSYGQLPEYIGGWDAAIMPFAINEATRYISPTKTPEYLAAGRQVVSTPIYDVVHDYGEPGLIYIAEDAAGFVKNIEKILSWPPQPKWKEKVETKLNETSWDRCAEVMLGLVERKLAGRMEGHPSIKLSDYV